MKPFNLEAAKNGAKVVTRNGETVRLLCFDLVGEQYNICGLRMTAGVETPEIWTEKGEYIENDSATSGTDLVMYPAKKTGWINIYRNDVSEIYDDEQEAKAGSAEHLVIDTIEIEWEE